MKSAFKTGDTVKILSGVEKNKTGKVLKIDRKKMRVLVEGIRMQTHYTRKSEKNPQGGMIKKEGFLPVCKLAKVEGAVKTDSAKKEKAKK